MLKYQNSKNLNIFGTRQGLSSRFPHKKRGNDTLSARARSRPRHSQTRPEHRQTGCSLAWAWCNRVNFPIPRAPVPLYTSSGPFRSVPFLHIGSGVPHTPPSSAGERVRALHGPRRAQPVRASNRQGALECTRARSRRSGSACVPCTTEREKTAVAVPDHGGGVVQAMWSARARCRRRRWPWQALAVRVGSGGTERERERARRPQVEQTTRPPVRVE